MTDDATTKLSSKGQVGQGDTVVLKTIAVPNLGQFDEFLADARRAARKAGLKRTDIRAATENVRGRA